MDNLFVFLRAFCGLFKLVFLEGEPDGRTVCQLTVGTF
jgi:hypothetical protein